MPRIIDNFRGEYAFLSNFYPSPVDCRNPEIITYLQGFTSAPLTSMLQPTDPEFSKMLMDLFGVPKMIDLMIFKTNEHFYQAFKANNLYDFIRIINIDTPAHTKKEGHKLLMQPDFERNKDVIMMAGLSLKYGSNPELKVKLMRTDDAILIEGNYWHDNYWGKCRCAKCINKVAQNKLGKMQMSLREAF